MQVSETSHKPALNQGVSGVTSASVRIRSATRSAHSALERTDVVCHLMSGHLSAQEYAWVLESWLCAWAPLEDLLACALPPGIDQSKVPAVRVHALRTDLFGVRAVVESCATPARAGDPDDPAGLEQLARVTSTRAGWMGLAYVLHGSLLGGAVVAAHLQRALPREVAHCTSFFGSHIQAPQGLAGQWRLWLDWLDGQLVTTKAQQEAADAAVVAFEFLARAWTVQAHLIGQKKR